VSHGEHPVLPWVMEAASWAPPLFRLSHCHHRGTSTPAVSSMCKSSLEHTPNPVLSIPKLFEAHLPTFQLSKSSPFFAKLNCQNLFTLCLTVTIQEQCKHTFKPARHFLVGLYMLHSLSKALSLLEACMLVSGQGKGYRQLAPWANAVCASCQESDPTLSHIQIKLMPKVTAPSHFAAKCFQTPA